MPLAKHLQLELGDVHEDVVRPEFGRQPAPALHVDEDVGLVGARLRQARIGQGRDRGLGQRAVGGKAAAALEAFDGVGHRAVVDVRRARRSVEGAGGGALQAEAAAEQRHARIAHAELEHRSVRQLDARRPLRPARPQAGKALLEGKVARLARIVGLQRVAGSVARHGEAGQHGVGGRQVEGRGDELGDRGEVHASAPRVAGVEGDRRGELEIGLGDLRIRVRTAEFADRRHRICVRVEPVLARGAQTLDRRLGSGGEGAVLDPDRLEVSQGVEGLHRLPVLAGQPLQEGCRILEPGVDGRRQGLARRDGGGRPVRDGSRRLRRCRGLGRRRRLLGRLRRRVRRDRRPGRWIDRRLADDRLGARRFLRPEGRDLAEDEERGQRDRQGAHGARSGSRCDGHGGNSLDTAETAATLLKDHRPKHDRAQPHGRAERSSSALRRTAPDRRPFHGRATLRRRLRNARPRRRRVP